jgi:hypothetical protein
MNRFMGYLAGNGLTYFIFEAAKREAFSHSLGQKRPLGRRSNASLVDAVGQGFSALPPLAVAV